jgi:DNA-binding NarL/FixJ family response regulator
LDWLSAGRAGSIGTVRRLAFEGFEVELIQLDAPAPMVARLPPALARLLPYLRAGLADKEIAQALDMPLATVRTYVARILKQTRIQSRRELMLRGRPAQ